VKTNLKVLRLSLILALMTLASSSLVIEAGQRWGR
jgi:hypothetical protein